VTHTTNIPPMFDEASFADDTEDEGRTHINRSLSFVDNDGMRVVLHWHEPLYRFAVSDRVMMKFVAVNLRMSGLATQEEIAQAFGHSVITQRRWEGAICLMRAKQEK